MDRSESIGNLAAALAKARASFKSISKDRSARIVSPKGSFSYSYADLATVVDATAAALAANEIAVMQPTTLSGGRVVITTVMAHSSGEWVSEAMEWPVVATDNRSIGSGITYARRHSLLAMVAAAATDEDDDAEAARGSHGSRPTAVLNHRGEADVTPAPAARPTEPTAVEPSDPELEERLALSVAIEKGAAVVAQWVTDTKAMSESPRKELRRSLYREAREKQKQSQDRVTSPSSSAAPAASQPSPSHLSSVPPPGTGAGPATPTTPTTSPPSELTKEQEEMLRDLEKTAPHLSENRDYLMLFEQRLAKLLVDHPRVRAMQEVYRKAEEDHWTAEEADEVIP